VKIAVLFGAGASYGAGAVVPHPPPLGGDLFDALQRAYEDTWGSEFTPEEIAVFREDFERGMSNLWANQGTRMQRLLIDMALYFTRFRLAGANCYSLLLDLLFDARRDIGVVFATLNYECLLEEATFRAGASVHSLWRVMPGHGGRRVVRILKPHGSCNYLAPMTRNIKDSTMADVGVAYFASEVPDPSDLEIVSIDEVIDIYATNGLTIPPAISLYEPTKHSPVGGGLIQKVREDWAALVAEADVVLSIGARPVEQDGHIWDAIIESSNAPVWFVGGQDEDYGRRAWQLGDRMHYLGFTFKQSLASIGERLDNLSPDKSLWLPGSS
jgi:hypothetical protein